MAEIVVASIGCVAMALEMGGEKVNDIIYRATVSHQINPKDKMNGYVQRIGTLRAARAEAHQNKNDEMTDDDWKGVPHIMAIREYGRQRPGIYNLYWNHRPILLHVMYMKWLHSIPMDSPLHEQGNYTETFVELHLKHFTVGCRARLQDRL